MTELRCTDHRDDEPYCLGRVESVDDGEAFTCTRCGTTWAPDVLSEQWSDWKEEFVGALLQFRDSGDPQNFDFFLRECGR